MMLTNRFAFSSFQRESLFLLVPSSGLNLPIHLNNNISASPRKTHISIGSEIQKNSVQFHLQHYASLLQYWGNKKDMNHGESLHSVLIKTGFDQDVFLQNNILRMYVNCGDLIQGRNLFDEMPEPNLVSYTTMISSYIQHGHVDHGMQLFLHMNRSGLRPNEFGFSSAIKACRITGEVMMGKLLHGCIIKCGFESYVFCNTSLVDMYVKCGNLNDARRLFDGVQSNCEVLWNMLIDGHVRNSDANAAVDLFHQMFLSNICPSCFTYTILMKLCTDKSESDLGRFLHGQIIKAGFENHTFVGGGLVDMYARWGCLSDACKVFWSLEERDNVVWSTLLAGFCQSGDAEEGLKLCLEFVSEGYKLDPFMLSSVFHLCSYLETPGPGFQVHSFFFKSGFLLDSFIGNAIVNMYISFGMVADAYKSFEEVRNKNEICFSTMIYGFLCDSEYFRTIKLFLEMRKLGMMPNHPTLNYILGAYSNLHMLEEGKAIHSHIVKTIGECDLYMEHALMEMYTKCGHVDEAILVFEEIEMPNEFSWTTVISGFIESERYQEALELFGNMNSSTSAKPSQFTLVGVLQACSGLAALNQGKQTHGYIIKLGFQNHVFIGSALIDMYAKSGSINDASQVFSNMSALDLVSWSSMVTAYAQHGHGEEALTLFSEFQDGQTTIDESIWSTCLSACASLVALDMGKQVHARIIRSGFESHLHVGSGIIDMYCKCGNIDDACKFFNLMRGHNVVSWTALVCGYAQHGLGKEALDLFNKMKEAGVEPDGVTFVGVLTACSHVGLVEEGWHYFEIMRNDYGLEVTVNHYACMVDILGRAGHIEEAEALINAAPVLSKASLWRTLLGACSKHGNLEVGNRIAELLVKLEPNQPSTYVLLSNIYASASMWDHCTEVRDTMREGSLNKDPGCSWIEVAT